MFEQATFDFNPPKEITIHQRENNSFSESILEENRDIVSRKQNSKENQEILEACKDKLNYQCRIILEGMKRGLQVMNGDKVFDYDTLKWVKIGDMRARIRDLIKAGVPIKKIKTEGNYKIYFLEQ